MATSLYFDIATDLHVLKVKGFTYNPKPGTLMLIERDSDGFVNIQSILDNKAYRQNTNGAILDDFVAPEDILDSAGDPYGSTADDIRLGLSGFFVDAPLDGAEIVETLEALEGDERLDASAIKNLPTGNFLSVVSTDSTITGNGTPGNPLSIATALGDINTILDNINGEVI